MTRAQCKRKHPIKFRKPWTVDPSTSKDTSFKRDLIRAGLLSPNFSIAEARCHDGQDLPHTFYKNAQRLAFTLEKVRHGVGNKPVVPLDWYRDPAYNHSIGGVTESQHMTGCAIDPNRQAMLEAGVNLHTFDVVAKEVFAHGGIGTDRLTGIVEHVDVGPDRRWTYN